VFSVIIPLYNKAAYIERAIQSVLSQTFQEFELIVVDDGSTDDSSAQLSVISYQLSVDAPEIYKKVRVIQQQNQGVSTARNNGVKLAKYDYIAFLDADDSWEPTYLEEMKGLIAAYPNAGIYGSSYFIVKNGKKRIAPIGVEKNFDTGLINYCQVYSKTLCMPLWTGAAIIRKSIVDLENGFNNRLKLGEDFDLWIRVAIKHSVAFLNKPLANYNQDVEEVFRGVVQNKIYIPETHFIFNLDYLSEYELTNSDLKKLLDLLRVYTLERYRLKQAYTTLVKKEIAKVDFSQQSLRVRLFYFLPIPILLVWYDFKKNIRKIYKLLAQ
jgi:glycosyltransferase involved in cell wall biosynthesis